MTLPDGYFDDVYAANDDPWDFQGSAYEAAKYARTLAALPRGHYGRGLEVGCSIGVLTGQLARRVDALLAVDVSEAALDRARARNAGAANITFERRRLPQDVPDGRFDLVVLSEVLYYLSREDLQTALDALIARTAPGGTVILVHWTPPVHDYPQTGDAVHEAALARAARGELTHVRGERAGTDRQGYRLDVFERPAQLG